MRTCSIQNLILGTAILGSSVAARSQPVPSLVGGPSQYFSPNKKFCAEISAASQDRAQIVISKVERGTRVLLWSRNVEVPAFIYNAAFEHVIVSDDGTAVALEGRFKFDGDPLTITILTQVGSEKQISSREILKLAGEKPSGAGQSRDTLWDAGLLSGMTLGYFDSVQGAQIFRLWSSQLDKWVAWRTTDGSSIAIDSSQREHWNAATRVDCLRVIAEYRPGALSRLIEPIKARAAEVLHLPASPSTPGAVFDPEEFP